MKRMEERSVIDPMRSRSAARMVGVRNLSSQVKSGEVWVNEMRLMEFNNKDG